MTDEEIIKEIENIRKFNYTLAPDEVFDRAIAAIKENKGEIKYGHWVRMSDLPEDKDDRYKCSQCGNVVHHSNGVNLYTFNSWCGRCGSLNNSLLANTRGE